MLYLEIAQGTVKNRNFIIREDHIKKYLLKARQLGEELYQSYYYYDEEILEHMKIRKTVKGFKGKYYLPHIIFDIDKGNNTDDFTLQRAKVFVQSLAEDWGVDFENLRVWFSGRGYHITIDNIFRFEPSNYLPEEVKGTIGKYFPEVDLMPFMHTGLIRVGYTKNIKVDRYKIPLSIDELFHLKAIDILEIAKQPDFRIMKISPIKSDLNWSDKIVRTQIAIEKKEKVTATLEPNSVVTCMQKLYNRGPVEGRRHTDILRMASAFARKGVPLRGTILMMKDWAQGLEPYEIEKDVNDIYNPDKQYRFSCSDPVMKEFCSPKCIHYNNKDYEPEIINAATAEKNFVKYSRSMKDKSSFDMAEIFPLKETFMCMAGEFILMIGDTKLGKTALAQFIALMLKKMKIQYYSTEVSERLIFRRFVQQAHSLTKKEVFEHYDINENSLSKELKHIDIVTTKPHLEELKKNIANSGAKLIILDTIDGMLTGKLGEFTSREEKIGFYLKDIVQSLDVIILGIHHIPKGAAVDEKGRPKKLGIHSGKGSSALEQQADKILGFEGNLHNDVRIFTSLGARDETPFRIQLKYDKSTFRFSKIMDLPLE